MLNGQGNCILCEALQHGLLACWEVVFPWKTVFHGPWKASVAGFSPWESPILFVMFEMHWVSDYFRDPLNARFIGTQLHWSTAGLLCFVMLIGPCCYCARHRTTGLPDTSHCRMSLAPWAQRSNVRSRGSDMIRVAAFLCSFKSAVTKTKCQWRFSYGNEHFTQILLDISSA
jgi:hypothetical protein